MPTPESTLATGRDASTEDEFAQFFETPVWASYTNTGIQWFSMVLTIAITSLLTPESTATYSVAFGLAMFGLSLTLIKTAAVDIYVVGRKERKIIKDCRAKLNKLKAGNARNWKARNEEFKKLKSSDHLISRTVLNLVAQLVSTGYVIFKFAGWVSGSIVMTSPYFLLGFMIAPLAAKGIIDNALQSTILLKKKEFIEFYHQINLEAETSRRAESDGTVLVPSVAKITTELPQATLIFLLARMLNVLHEREFNALIEEVIKSQPELNESTLKAVLIQLKTAVESKATDDGAAAGVGTMMPVTDVGAPSPSMLSPASARSLSTQPAEPHGGRVGDSTLTVVEEARTPGSNLSPR